MDPKQLRFSPTHEWVHLETSSDEARTATVGISAFAIAQLTDLVHMELPAVGRAVKPGDSIGEIESVKAVSDLYSPVAGEIVAVNQDLPGNLESMGEDPYGKSWVVKIRLTSDAGLEQLMDYATYDAQCKG